MNVKWEFPEVGPGEWVKPKRKYYYMGCCDCGLVHKMEFKIVPYNNGHAVLFRAWRDKPRTRQLRRVKKR